MAKWPMVRTVNVNSTLAIGMASTVISAIVHFTPAVILQQAESGLRAREYGTVQTAIVYIKRKLLNISESLWKTFLKTLKI